MSSPVKIFFKKSFHIWQGAKNQIDSVQHFIFIINVDLVFFVMFFVGFFFFQTSFNIWIINAKFSANFDVVQLEKEQHAVLHDYLVNRFFFLSQQVSTPNTHLFSLCI